MKLNQSNVCFQIYACCVEMARKSALQHPKPETPDEPGSSYDNISHPAKSNFLFRNPFRYRCHSNCFEILSDTDVNVLSET